MRIVAAVLMVGALVAGGFAVREARAQEQKPPTYDEVMAAKAQVEGQRDFAQGQAQQAAATAQQLGRENKALKERNAELEKLCGDACKPKAEAKK